MTTAAPAADGNVNGNSVSTTTLPEPTDVAAAGIWSTILKLFRGEYPSLFGLSVSSFLGGICEAVLLVLIANLALAIGGNATAAGKTSVFGLSGLDTRSLFLVAVALTALRLSFQYLAARLTARTTTRLTQRIRSGTFDDYVHASWALQSAESEAAIQDLLQRHVAKAQAAVITVGLMIRTGFMVLALVGSSFIVDPAASGLIIAVGLVLFVGLRPLTIRAKKLGKRQAELGITYGVQAREAVDLSLEIRAFGVSDQVAERLDRATAAEVAPLYRAQLMARMVTVVYTSAAVLILLSALLALDTFLNRPLASIGAIVVVLIRALNQTSGLQTSYHGLGDLVPYIERLDQQRARFRRSTPPSGSARLERIGVLAFQQVNYSYDHHQQALADVSFEVRPGESVGIIGPSGSGKSTLIQLLLRLRHPDSGTYTIGGVDVTDVEDDSWFSRIAFVPQDSRIFDDTVAANVAFFRPGVSRDQIESAARRAHVHDEIMAMPDGYDTVLGSRGGSVSGGQRQRIAIARALVVSPSMLVLDEPTSALDMRSESLVHQTLNDLQGSVTLFVIAHRLSTLNTCDRIMVLRDGVLQAFGDRTDLQANNEFYRQALDLSRIRG